MPPRRYSYTSYSVIRAFLLGEVVALWVVEDALFFYPVLPRKECFSSREEYENCVRVYKKIVPRIVEGLKRCGFRLSSAGYGESGIVDATLEWKMKLPDTDVNVSVKIDSGCINVQIAIFIDSMKDAEYFEDTFYVARRWIYDVLMPRLFSDDCFCDLPERGEKTLTIVGHKWELEIIRKVLDSSAYEDVKKYRIRGNRLIFDCDGLFDHYSRTISRVIGEVFARKTLNE